MAETNVAKVSSKTVKSNGGPKIKQWVVRFGKFLKESYYEVKKCAWPSWLELRQFTIVVIFALVVVAAWMAGINSLMTAITKGMLGGSYSP